MSSRAAWLVISAAAACGTPDDSNGGLVEVQLAAVVDQQGEGRVDLEVEAPATVRVFMGGQARIVEAAIGSTWIRPQSVLTASIDFNVPGEGPVAVTIWARGAP